MVWCNGKYHKSFKAVSSHPRLQDNHSFSPLTPFQFLFHMQYHAFSLDCFWWQACFNIVLLKQLSASSLCCCTFISAHSSSRTEWWFSTIGYHALQVYALLGQIYTFGSSDQQISVVLELSRSPLLYFVFKSHGSPLTPAAALKHNYLYLCLLLHEVTQKSSFKHVISEEEYLLRDACIQLLYLYFIVSVATAADLFGFFPNF